LERCRSYEQKNRQIEVKLKTLESELEKLKESKLKESSMLTELRAREEARASQIMTNGEKSNYDYQIDEQEKKINSVESQLLRLCLLQKDLDLKEQNLKKSRERFLERLQSAGERPNSSLLELANLQAKKEIELLQTKVEEQSKILIENENFLELLQVQTKLLKGEIRTYERQVKREENYKNLEYVKNIVLKYIQTHNDQLIPVICNLLQFSAEENSLVRHRSLPVSPRQPETNGIKRLTGFWF